MDLDVPSLERVVLGARSVGGSDDLVRAGPRRLASGLAAIPDANAEVHGTDAVDASRPVDVGTRPLTIRHAHDGLNLERVEGDGRQRGVILVGELALRDRPVRFDPRVAAEAALAARQGQDPAPVWIEISQPGVDGGRTQVFVAMSFAVSLAFCVPSPSLSA